MAIEELMAGLFKLISLVHPRERGSSGREVLITIREPVPRSVSIYSVITKWYSTELCPKHCSTCLAFIKSFHCHSAPMMKTLSLFLLYRWGNWGTGRLNNRSCICWHNRALCSHLAPLSGPPLGSWNCLLPCSLLLIGEALGVPGLMGQWTSECGRGNWLGPTGFPKLCSGRSQAELSEDVCCI